MDETQKNLDAIAFALRGIFAALGVERCAAAMGCDRQTAYSYQAADQVIPVKRLLRLLALVRESSDPAARDQAHKIVQVFALTAGEKVIDGAVIEHLNRAMDAVNNGGKLKEHKTEQCPQCRSDLFTERTASGVIIQRCRRCFGAGTIEA